MIVGLDVGSSSVKAVAVDGEGRVADMRRVRSRARSGGGVDGPESIWREVTEVLRASVEAVGSPEAVALSASMHSLVVLVDGEVVSWSTWLDRKPHPDTGMLAGAGLYAETGCPPWGVYLPAVLAAMAHDRSRAGLRIQTLKEWLYHRLTGETWIDPTTASTTGLLRMEGGSWSELALGVAGISAPQLPALVPAAATAPISGAAAAETGLHPGVPVVVGGADGILAHLAAAGERPGSVSLSVGTTAAIRVATDSPWLHPEARTWCYRRHASGHLAGMALNNAGLLLDWVRRLLYSGVPASEGFDRMFQEAGTVPVGAEGVRIVAGLVPERAATADEGLSIVGLRPRHEPGHMARAALDRVVTGLAGAAKDLTGARPQDREVHVVGLPVDHPELARALGDALGRPLRLISLPDASAVGAALIGYEAITGSRPEPESESRLLTPDPEGTAAYAQLMDAGV